MPLGRVWLPVAVVISLAAAPASFAANAQDCPNGGAVRFGVEPFDTSAKLVPIYNHLAELIGKKLGCKVKVFVATNYNAEIEAMRSGKLEIGEFGPLGYVLAHQVAKAEAVATFANKNGNPESYRAASSPGQARASTRSPRSAANVSPSPIRPRPRAIFSPPTGCARPASIRQGYQGILRRQPHSSYEALDNHKAKPAS